MKAWTARTEEGCGHSITALTFYGSMVTPLLGDDMAQVCQRRIPKEALEALEEQPVLL